MQQKLAVPCCPGLCPRTVCVVYSHPQSSNVLHVFLRKLHPASRAADSRGNPYSLTVETKSRPSFVASYIPRARDPPRTPGKDLSMQADLDSLLVEQAAPRIIISYNIDDAAIIQSLANGSNTAKKNAVNINKLYRASFNRCFGPHREYIQEVLVQNMAAILFAPFLLFFLALLRKKFSITRSSHLLRPSGRLSPDLSVSEKSRARTHIRLNICTRK